MAVVRGCGTRVAGGIYAECPLSPYGMPMEHFLVDPPIPVDTQEMGVTPVGVKLVERKGVWHIMDWVGSTHYLNVADFVEECLLPDELIICQDGLKPISIIAENDKVLTHRGRFQKVLQTNKRQYSGQLLSVKSTYWSDPLRLTPEHPVYRAKVLRGRERINQHGLTGEEILEQGFVPAKEICKDDYLCFPLYKETRDIETVDMAIEVEYPLEHGNRKISSETREKVHQLHEEHLAQVEIGKKLGVHRSTVTRILRSHRSRRKMKTIPVNKHLMSLCGYYLAEGSVADTTQRGKDNYFSVTEFSFGLEGDQDEERFAKNVKTHAEALGFSAGVTLKDGCWHVLVYSRYLAHFLVENFGRGAKNKRIPAWVLTLPPEKQKWLFFAEIDGDGHFSKHHFSSSTVSLNLAHGLRLIAHRLCYRASINKRGDGCYIVTFYENTGNDVFVKDDYIYLRVTDVSAVEYVGEVYNIAVEEDESYCTIYHALHNCRRFGLSRRLSTSLDFKKLTSQSRILLLHSHGYIYNFDKYQKQEPKEEYLMGLVPYAACPKRLPEHTRPDMETMCARLWYQDVTGGEDIERKEGQEYTDAQLRCVTRKMPSFEYHALVQPEDVTPEYRVAIFASFPITNLAVVKDNDGGTHNRSLMLAEEARLPVELVEE